MYTANINVLASDAQKCSRQHLHYTARRQFYTVRERIKRMVSLIIF